MKKRVISLVLVVMMLMTLFPVSAFASVGDCNIVKQPVDAYVYQGETATFSIAATNPNSADLTYLWIDMEKIDADLLEGLDTDLSLTAVADVVKKLKVAKAGEGRVLSIPGVTEDMDGKSYICAVYWTNILAPRDLTLSNSVTLHVYGAECANHSVDVNLEKIDAKTASCAHQGNIEYYNCIVCGRYYLDPGGMVKTTLKECMLPKSEEHGNISFVEGNLGTCCQKGSLSYYACEVCGQKFLDSTGLTPIADSTVELDKDPANHVNLQEMDATSPTCSQKGTTHHWYCSGCDDYFSDAEGLNEISKSKVELDKDPSNHAYLKEQPAVAASCKAPGNIRYFYCADCEGYFTDSDGANKVDKSQTVLKQLEHDNQWCAMESGGVEWHEYRCTICGTVEKTGSHEGGVASCSARATCSVCGVQYGEKNPDSHPNQERVVLKEATPEEKGLCNLYCKDCGKLLAANVEYEFKEACEHSLAYVDEVPAKCEEYKGVDKYGVKEHYVCEKCGTVFSDEKAEKEVTDMSSLEIAPVKHYYTVGSNVVSNMLVQEWGYDSSGHWKKCKWCGYNFTGTGGVHTYMPNAEPTCCTGKTCILCGYDNGDIDPTNHCGPFETVGIIEPEGDKEGYTGDKVCQGCGNVTEKGRHYYQRCAEGCTEFEHHAAVPSTCTQDGVREYWVCTRCNNIYMDSKGTQPGDANSIVEVCTGHDLHPGTDSLNAKTILSLIDTSSFSDFTLQDIIDLINGEGSISAPEIPSIDDFLSSVHVKDIDHCYDDTHHWLGCQKCGKTLEDLKLELESAGITINSKWYELSRKNPHTGGVATCQSKAICDECGECYGEMGSHRYDRVVETGVSCTEMGVVKYICTVCKTEDTAREEHYPARGHQFVKGQCTREGCNARVTNPFFDVSNKDVYYTAVMWAYTFNPQITAGTDENHFSPTAPCTRGQVVTFLWRAAGYPEPETEVNPFSDVFNYGSCKPFYKAILWASENGIASGYSDGSFRPGATVSRAEFVTFLWRYYGKPMPATNLNPFVDVAESSPFRTAILWAYGQGITMGYDDTHFQPNTVCNRWQVVMFMYRAIGENKAFE